MPHSPTHLKISRAPPTYREGTKALRGDVICPKSNTCARYSWEVDAGLSMLWDPFPTLILNGWAVATPALRTTLANPASQWGTQRLGAPRRWEVTGPPGAASIRLRPGGSLLPVKITQGGIDRRAAAHNTDWIKERGPPAICPGRDGGVSHQLSADPMESWNPEIKGWQRIALLAFKCAISCLLLISLVCAHVHICIYRCVCVIHIYTIFLFKILTLFSHCLTLY